MLTRSVTFWATQVWQGTLKIVVAGLTTLFTTVLVITAVPDTVAVPVCVNWLESTTFEMVCIVPSYEVKVIDSKPLGPWLSEIDTICWLG